jgi:predicted oxidoreductase
MATSIFSNIIAGTMNWGVWGKNLDTQEMITLMHHFIENNTTSFDHADIYGNYTTEASFGKAFKESKIERKQLQFISKCGIQLKVTSRNNAVKHYEYSKDYIIKSVEQSLQNLQTDYLDLLLLHRPSPLMQTDEIAAAVDHLKTSGKIIDFGVSNFSASQINLLRTKTGINYNQIEFSLTHNEAMHNGNLDYMQTHNIVPMAWSPIGNIFKEKTEKIIQLKNVLANFAEKYNTTIDTILLAWILKHPAGIIPVCGTTDISKIKNQMKANSINMELQDWFALLQESDGKEMA